MKTYRVDIVLRAECHGDAEELVREFTGQETDLLIQYPIVELEGDLEDNVVDVSDGYFSYIKEGESARKDGQ